MREGWKICKLGDVLLMKKDKHKPDSTENLFYIGLEHIEKGTGRLTEAVGIEEINAVKNTFKSGNILYGKLRPYLNKAHLATQDGVCSTDILVFEPSHQIDPKFALNFILSRQFVNDMSENTSGVNLPRVSTKYVQNYQVPLPPLETQKAIVAKIEELFSELDNGIANLQEARRKIDIYRQSVLKKAFEGELTKEWRSRQPNLPTGEELLAQIQAERQRHYELQVAEWKSAVKTWEKNGTQGRKPGKPKKSDESQTVKEKELKSLQQIPEEWCYGYLTSAGIMGRGKSKHRPRNDPMLYGGKYPFIQTGDVKAQDIVREYSQTYNDLGLSQSKLWPKGTLCITIAANIAETSFLGIDACFPDSIVGFTPYHSIIDSKYIEYFFRSAKSRISAFAPATAQKNINLNTLENLIVPLCSIQEQTQIVQEIESRLSVCDKLTETIDNSLKQAEAMRQSILKKAFEGKLK